MYYTKQNKTKKKYMKKRYILLCFYCHPILSESMKMYFIFSCFSLLSIYRLVYLGLELGREIKHTHNCRLLVRFAIRENISSVYWQRQNRWAMGICFFFLRTYTYDPAFFFFFFEYKDYTFCFFAPLWRFLLKPVYDTVSMNFSLRLC